MATGSVRNVPVHWDGRTLEQRHRDLMSSLRNRFGRRASTDRRLLAQNQEWPLQVRTETHDWPDVMNQWVSETNDWWNAEMRRLRDDMLPLVPIDLFGMGSHDFFAPYGDVRSVLDRMDRQMRALTQHFQREAQQEMGANSLIPHTEGGLLGFLKDAYQPGEDGRVHFKVRFDLQGYGPEDIEVTSSDNGLTVRAKKAVQTGHGSSVREYSRTLYLPQSIDKDKLECHLTEDGVLNLEAPVKAADYKSITFDRNRQLSIKPKSETEVSQKQQSENVLAIRPTGVDGPMVLKDEKSGGEKLHVEIPVDSDFTANDLCVRMDANQVVVSGKKSSVDETPNSKSAYVKEFTRSYNVPETVDTFSVNAQLHGGKLLIEAPLLCPSK